jgi:hypothetical protein
VSCGWNQPGGVRIIARRLGDHMLRNLKDQVHDCLQRAADCAQRAKAAKNPRERKEWQELEERYLRLANSVELTGRADRLANEVGKTHNQRKSPSRPHQATA